MKQHWTPAELLSALAAPARKATEGVARALGLRAEGAEDAEDAEERAVATRPLRPDPAWAAAARAVVRPGWVTPSPVQRHVTLDTTTLQATAAPAQAALPPGDAAEGAFETVAPFESLGAHPVADEPAPSMSLGFEPLNHPLLQAAPRAERGVYERGAARAAWATFDPDPLDGPAPAGISLTPTTEPASALGAPAVDAPTFGGPRLDRASPPEASGALAEEEGLDRAGSPAASRPPRPAPPPSPAAPAASLEFEPSLAPPPRAAHTPAALPAAEPPTATDLEVLGGAFSDPFVAWRPGGRGTPSAPRAAAEDDPTPTSSVRLPLHPAPRPAPTTPSTLELQGAEAPRPLRLRDLGRGAAPAAAAPRAARAPLDELFDDRPPELDDAPEGPAFSSIVRAPAPPAPSPRVAAPSPARLRPAEVEAFEPTRPAAPPATRPTPLTPSAPAAPATGAAPASSAAPTPSAAPAAAGLDRDSLEEAMTEVLRDAARQHGLEV